MAPSSTSMGQACLAKPEQAWTDAARDAGRPQRTQRREDDTLPEYENMGENGRFLARPKRRTRLPRTSVRARRLTLVR